MTEKSYYADLTKFYRARSIALGQSIVWEAKFTRTNSISFKKLVPHQELSMLEAERAYGYKIPDAGKAKKPFDGMAIFDAKALFIAIYFNGKKSEVYELELRTFIDQREYSGLKSLTREDADRLGRLIVI